ncbi:MAG: DUF3995 domain-containing protein, partial [Kribbellaceae bacterium]|nr:DUF3995 domain-containing protein [Kribbellaceae bacterium]
MQSRRIVAGVHALLAAVHVYWATGATWPALDERSLSRAVLGVQVSFAPQVVLPLAALHLMLAAAVLYSNRSALARLAVAGVAAGLATRAALGVVWVLTYASTPFYWLNLFVYTPACIALCFADVTVLRIRWLKATVIAGPVAVLTMLAAVAYVYEPGEQAHPADAALV